jgi:quinol-cytochrome oxidoreductase complex cytochrome b subunit
VKRPLLDWLETRFNLTEMFSVLTGFGLFPSELDTRRPLGEAVDEALGRPLSSYARWPRVLGLLSFILFLFVGLTGILLAFYYQPTASEAFSSVTTIVRDVNFGWFVHQTHRWGALVLLGILLVRLWRFFFQGLYKSPREAIWIVAVLTFLAATHADLTGRLLVWDSRGYWTTVRAVEILFTLPGLGPLFAALIGGTEIDSLVLTRFYVLHALVLPALLLIFFYLHFSSVRRVGLSPAGRQGNSGQAGAGRSSYRVYLYNLLILTVFILGGLVTLATLLPERFGVQADPLNTLAGVRPPWYLLAAHGLVESLPQIVPRSLRGLAIEATLLACILLPFIDRSKGRTLRERRWALTFGFAVLLLWVAFTVVGYRLEAGR